MTQETIRIALAGAGLIGRRHAALIQALEGVELAGIADPSDAARHFAEGIGAAWFPTLEEVIGAARPDGVLIATPNQLHRAHGEAAIAAGLPVLIEKPLADTVENASALVTAARAANVALLVGHHRRHNPLIARAKAAIDDGRLGQIVGVQASFWLTKPEDYFDTAWRRAPGAGPVLINLIHDIDLLRHLCGEITSITAIESNARRGFDVEDTAAALLRFANGALGTLTASDTIAAPWSWEMTAGENPAYPRTDQHCYLIGGTHGSLSLPQGALWSHPGARSWWAPLASETLAVPTSDPLVHQIEHFRDVIRGEVQPLVTGEDGLAALKVLEAMKISAREERQVLISRSSLCYRSENGPNMLTGQKVTLVTLNGSKSPPEDVLDHENYWRLIGLTGKVVDDNASGSFRSQDGFTRVLVQFEPDLTAMGLENHNEIDNSLWIRVADLRRFT